MSSSGAGMAHGCRLCPRTCGARRELGERGRCGAGAQIRAARAALHFWEEPCVSTARGSGTVFFSGCPLGCCFCQNRVISRDGVGRNLTEERLAEVFLSLQEQGAANLNLVSATQYIPQIRRVLEQIRPQLHIPVIWNTGGYELPAALALLRGLVDVYLTDLKFFDPALSGRLADAPDYFSVACACLPEMLVQTGAPRIGSDGSIQKGVIIRHLVLPGHREDSRNILEWLARNLSPDSFLLSLMRQYTPDPQSPFRELRRPVATAEYRPLAELAAELGFQGYTQERESAREGYTPDFDLTGL